ncbi:MAG: hypothetical protein MHMPM18_004367, partial [Marteilia pararefringens]
MPKRKYEKNKVYRPFLLKQLKFSSLFCKLLSKSIRIITPKLLDKFEYQIIHNFMQGVEGLNSGNSTARTYQNRFVAFFRMVDDSTTPIERKKILFDSLGEQIQLWIEMICEHEEERLTNFAMQFMDYISMTINESCVDIITSVSKFSECLLGAKIIVEDEFLDYFWLPSIAFKVANTIHEEIQKEKNHFSLDEIICMPYIMNINKILGDLINKLRLPLLNEIEIIALTVKAVKCSLEIGISTDTHQNCWQTSTQSDSIEQQFSPSLKLGLRNFSYNKHDSQEPKNKRSCQSLGSSNVSSISSASVRSTSSVSSSKNASIPGQENGRKRALLSDTDSNRFDALDTSYIGQSNSIESTRNISETLSCVD